MYKAKYDPLLFKLPKGVITKNNNVKFFVEYLGDKEPNIAYFMIKRDEDYTYQYLQMERVDGGYFFERNKIFVFYLP